MRTSLVTGAESRADADARAALSIAALVALPPGSPDRAALRQRAIEAWLPMSQRLTRRYARRGELDDDLRQTAAVGLIKAIDRYNPEKGLDFVSFAVPTILGEIKRYFRDRSWSVRIPRRLQELNSAVQQARAELGHTLSRAPTVADVAAHLNVSEEEVLEALEGGNAYHAVPMSSPVGGSELELGDTIGAIDAGYDMVDLTASLPQAMGVLDEREKQIIMLRFFGNQTQAHIAEQIGLSQMHVSRLLTRTLRKLRGGMT